MSSLLENLNSDLMKAYAGLKSKKSPKRILVYVESHEDQSFWRDILDQYETEKITFDIQLPSNTSLAQGKIKAIQKEREILSLNIGTYLIICIDSDIDYLLQNQTETSQKINSSEYIFQTYSYSLENLRCFSRSLHMLCVQSTKNDKKHMDVELIILLYSKITYKLFVWYLCFLYNNDYDTFTLTDFNSVVKILDRVDIADEGRSALLKLNERVISKVSELESLHPSCITQVDNLIKTVETLGLTEEHTYLFIQGHTIQDNVVLMFLKPLSNFLRAEKIREIKINASNTTERINEINHYSKQTLNIADVIKLNTEFKTCFLYKKITADLDNYISKL